MSRIAFDAFASPAQVGEIHRLGWTKAWFGAEKTDRLVYWVTKKYPRDLTREEAAKFIASWVGIVPDGAEGFYLTEGEGSE